jgi:hypothetical protein
MKAVFLLQTVLGDEGPLAADTEHQFEDAEADRLIGLGIAVDPALRVVEAAPEAISIQTLQEAVAAAKSEAAVTIGDLEAKLADANAALTAAQAEIDRLTTALAAAEKKAK